MANDHPFQLLFETLGRVPSAHAEAVNRQAYEILSDILSVPIEKTGRCILLRAPRAGHGKTHLLSRIQHQLGASYEFIPLHASFGCRIDAASVTDDCLRRLVRQLPAAGGLTALDLVTRRLFASALQPLVSSGEVPCQDREGALTALRSRPIETFDFHHPNAVTAHWARENFEVLGQRLSLELAQRADLPAGDVAFWVDGLFRFASAPLDNTSRVRALAEHVHGGTGEAMERLEALLSLLTTLTRVVLVADDLEGFSADETAALRLAAFLGSLRQSVERLDVILSLNQDIWQSAFLPRLSGGLADRLSEIVVELEPLTEAEMAALLDSRVPGLGDRVLQRIDIGAAGTHARGLIRAAGMAWLRATAMDSVPAAVLAAAPAAAAFEPPAVPNYPPPPEPVIGIPQVPEPTQVAPVELPGGDTTAFSFSPEPPSKAEEPVVWPAPEFVPVDPEPEFEPAPADSPFQIEPPISTFSLPSWQDTPPTAGEFTSEPAPIAQPVEPPHQAEPPVATFSPPEWQEEPSAFIDPTLESSLFSPPVDSPFQPESPAQLPAETFGTQEWRETPTFQPDPGPVQPWNPPASAAEITPEPPYQSPFEVAPPQFVPEPAPATFNPPQWQESPQFSPRQQPLQATIYQPPVESPFQVAAEPFTPVFEPAPVIQPAPEPVFNPPPQQAEVPPPPTAADTDRVDDLLRQFRERYGRGSL